MFKEVSRGVKTADFNVATLNTAATQVNSGMVSALAAELPISLIKSTNSS